MRFIGIDPGLDGAIALLDGDLQLEVLEDMPTVSEKGGTKRRVNAAELSSMLREMASRGPCVAALERVASRPGSSAASMFSFGTSYGICIGVLAALGVGVHLITPSEWKRVLNVPSGADKEVSRAMAIELYPTHSASFSRKSDHDRAEAILLARVSAMTRQAA